MWSTSLAQAHSLVSLLHQIVRLNSFSALENSWDGTK